MRLHLIRHGQSVWNELRLLQGQTMQVGLTELGVRQARELADRLADHPIGRLFSSDQRRAVQTADVLGARLGLVPILDARLREQGRGRLEGLPTDAVLAMTAEVDWADPSVRVGGGESVLDVCRRLSELFDSLRAQVGPAGRKDVILVSHGDTIRIACGLLEGLAPVEIGYRLVDNGSIITMALTDGPPGEVLLDIGCGTGGPARLLARKFGVSVTSISNSATHAATCQRLNNRAPDIKDRLKVVVGDAQQVVPPGQYDAAVSINMLYQVADHRRLFGNVLAGLRPGGRFVVDDWMLTPLVTEQDLDELAEHFSYVSFGRTNRVVGDLTAAGFAPEITIVDLGHVGRGRWRGISSARCGSTSRRGWRRTGRMM